MAFAQTAAIGASAHVDSASAQPAHVEPTAVHDTSDMAERAEASEEAVDGDDAEDLAQAEQPKLPPPPRLGGENRLDGIAAVVGDEIVLVSELEAYVYMRLAAAGVEPQHADMKTLVETGMTDLIDNKVLLVRAKGDSTINVRNDEVESTLNNHISMILQQNRITMEQFEFQLRAQQGTTMARFKSEARRAIREQLYKQKLQQSYYFGAKVNRRDVEEFYAKYGDSLPVVGESFELLKLSVRLAPSDSVRQAAFDKIRAAKRELDAGGNFEELAKKYSESPEGASGGDLGYLSKGSTELLALEERAFALAVGQASEPFETRLGYHIILVEEKRDMRVKLRQILVRSAPTEQEREALVARLDSLRGAIKDRVQFEAAARAQSVDAPTRTRGGAMGWLTLLELPPTVREAVQNLEEGQISVPVADDNILSIYMVSKRADSRKLTLDNDYAVIAEKARDITAQLKLLDMIKQWREKTYIDKRI
jgi:peptidyl-prolyl cis-trans isomerase SurA